MTRKAILSLASLLFAGIALWKGELITYWELSILYLAAAHA